MEQNTEGIIQHFKAQHEKVLADLASGALKESSVPSKLSKLRAKAKEQGLDPDTIDTILPTPGKANKAPRKRQRVTYEIIEATARPGGTIAISADGRIDTRPIPIAEITDDTEIQQRAAHVDMALRAEYAEAMQNGAQFPPIVAFRDGDAIWLADGFHRIGAAADIGRTEILAQIHEGTRRDALLYAVGANADHGARRTPADKRRAVQTLLADSVWSTMSSSEIARAAKVSHTLVDNIRKEQAGNSTCNVASEIDDEGEEEATTPDEPPAPAPAVRQTKDGRRMNTANIGKKPAAKAKAPPASKPKGPTAADAQQALNHFAGACNGLREVESKLTGNEIFKVAQLARDTLIHFLPTLKEQDRDAMVAKVCGHE